MAQLTIQQTFEQALRHHQSGRLQEAEQAYRRILQKQRSHFGALHFSGVLAHQRGQHAVAIDLIRRAIVLKPNWPEAHNNLGLTLAAAGQLDQAITAYKRSLELRPNYANAFYNLGIALKARGQLADAIAAHRRAIALQPTYVEAYTNLGIDLAELGQRDEAIACLRAAIAHRPAYAQAHYNLGNIFKDEEKLDEAIAAYRQAIAADPRLAQAYNNLGNTLTANWQIDEAAAAYRQALALDPNSSKAYDNLGYALGGQGKRDESIAAHRKAIELDIHFHGAHSNLLLAMQYHSGCTAQEIAEEHRRWNEVHALPLRDLIRPFTNDRDPARDLRIGYVSPDFQSHVVGQNLLPLLRHSDRRQFEITCYANAANPDAMTQEFQHLAHRWRNIVGLSDERAAELIREDQIDILVDLSLHTANNRLMVFARKPAPVQVTYLAYCGSSGMSAMDYRLSDPYIDPDGTDLSVYAEQTVRLPRTYWCYQPQPAPDPAPPPMLQTGFITFGCLNNFAKVSSAALTLWTEILSAVPSSRLFLHSPSGRRRDEIARQLASAGIEGDRLHFSGRQTFAKYMETYAQIDIALDPFPYGGGITTLDALWMGVPVITLSGATAVGRGGRSILSNLGLTELIGLDPGQYAQIAIELASDRDRMLTLRSGLRARMLASPLLDAVGFARDVEAAYRMMWHKWCATAATINER
jgi:protein O-GlcNAc transferase